MSYSQNSSASTVSGAAAGAGAFLIGLVLTYILAQLEINLALSFVVALVPIEGTIFSYLGFHTLEESFELWFTLIPAVLLFVSGLTVASGTRGNPVEGFTDGAKVTSGYLAMTLFGVLVMFLVSGEFDLSGDIIADMIVAGVVFPIVFGGLGGALAESM